MRLPMAMCTGRADIIIDRLFALYPLVSGR